MKHYSWEEFYASYEDWQPGHCRCTYVYDFGDFWEHEIIKEKTVTGNVF